MIDSLMNLLFRCSHQRLTRPMAPISKAGAPHSPSYVVCLDCGKQFEYDVEHMHMGKALVTRTASRKKRFALGMLAAAPAAILLGAAWKKKKRDGER